MNTYIDSDRKEKYAHTTFIPFTHLHNNIPKPTSQFLVVLNNKLKKVLNIYIVAHRVCIQNDLLIMKCSKRQISHSI